MIRSPRWRLVAPIVALALVAGFPAGASAIDPYLTGAPLMLALRPDVPAGSDLLAIINSRETLTNGFMFEGIPDGIGAMPGPTSDTVDVFVNHEQSHVPFFVNAAIGIAGDLEDASVSRLTLDTETGAVVDARVVIEPELGLLRFCSATMAGPNEGLDRYLFFTNEESNDIVPVPAGAPYGADPQIAPNRQGGYAVVLDPSDDSLHLLAGAGRHNHENDMVIPGGWDQIAVLSGDDTFFSSPLPDWSQLYLYLADNEDQLLADQGSLWAFQVTHTDDGKVDAANPFNGANDYGDIASGDDWRGRFIRVPDKVARGLTAARPQDALEDWSNAHNVFQFIRVEDTAYDPNDPRVVYIADTGDGRMVLPEVATGRLTRGSAQVGVYPNGRIFRMEFHPDNPRKVTSFSILLNNDLGGRGNPNVMHQPDNLGTSGNSLMAQEDTSQAPGARIWRYDFSTGSWSIVADINNGTVNESSGIVDASEWFGPGTWLLAVQAHDDLVPTPVPPGPSFKREGGQLVLMTIPGS